MTLTVLDLAPGLNGSKGLMRMHYQAYRRLRDTWTLELRAASSGKAPAPCRIHIRRLICRQPMDLDNLYATAKVPLDALRHAGIIPDDDPEAVTTLRVTQERAPSRKEEKTIIEILPA